MYKFVKVKDHPNWFLVVDGNTIISDSNIARFGKKMENVVIGAHDRPDWLERVAFTNNRTIDYTEKAQKYGTLLVREIGSYMRLGDSEITEIRYSNKLIFENSDAKICIIENSNEAEPDWTKYLAKRFPDQAYKVINNFSVIQPDEICEMLKGVETVTFCTTFTNFDWFHKLMECLKIVGTQVHIIGYCWNEEKWNELDIPVFKGTFEIVPTIK